MRIIDRTTRKVDSKGRIVLPKSFREVGTSYEVTVYEDRIVLKPTNR